MEVPLSELRCVPLPVPARGLSVRLRLGRMELVLEGVRGGYSLLCLDGERARTWSLGLAGDGELWLSCRVPRLPLQLGLKDTLVMVPGSRVRGYVQIELVPTILWRAAGGPEQTVAELLPGALSAEWDDRRGACVQRVTSPLFQRLPPPGNLPRAMLPLRLANRSMHTLSPESLPLQLSDGELRVCRGHLLLHPRRLGLQDDGQVVTVVRAAGKAVVSVGEDESA